MTTILRAPLLPPATDKHSWLFSHHDVHATTVPVNSMKRPRQAPPAPSLPTLRPETDDHVHKPSPTKTTSPPPQPPKHDANSKPHSTTQSDVYMMSAHAFEHLRQTKEFGLRVIFSLPLAGPGASAAAASTVATLSPVAHPSTSASIAAASAEAGVVPAGFDAISGTAGGGGSGGGRATVHAAVGLPPSRGAAVSPPRRRRRWGVFLRRLVCWRGAERRFLGERWWRRPATRYVFYVSIYLSIYL